MKKLMFAAAVVAAGVAMADVTSANVVGYAGNQLNGGYMTTLVTPQFTQVGNTSTNFIGNIKCSEDMLGLVYLNTLTEDGQYADSYTWDAHWSGNIGWISDSGAVVTDVGFIPGTGFWIQCDVDEGMGDIMSSGQVSTGDVTTELNPNYMITLVGNASPVKVNLADVYCPDECLGLVYLNRLQPDGTYAESYTWDMHWSGTIGWIGDDGAVATDVELDPGEAFWVQCDAEEPGSITFPGCELK